MHLRRKPNPGESDSFAQEVVASLERTGLDRETTLVMGGSALALAGIRRAGDVDVMVPHAAYRNFVSNGKLPSGIPLQPKYGTQRPFLETIPTALPTGMLAVDLTHPHDNLRHDGNPELDDQFLREISSFGQIAGYRFLPPELVADHKQHHRTGRMSHKDRKDLRLIRQHLTSKK